MNKLESTNFESEPQKLEEKDKNELVNFRDTEKNHENPEDKIGHERIINKEKSLFSKFQGKAELIAKALIIFTTLTFLPKEPFEKEVTNLLVNKNPIALVEKFTDREYRHYDKMINKENAYQVLVESDRYKDKPWARDVIYRASEIEPVYTLSAAYQYMDKQWGKDLIEKISADHPDGAILNLIESYRLCEKDTSGDTRPWLKKLILKTIKQNPICYLEREGESKSLVFELINSNDPILKNIGEINKKFESEAQKKMALLLLPKLVDGTIKLEEIDEYFSYQNKVKYFVKLLEIREEGYYGPNNYYKDSGIDRLIPAYLDEMARLEPYLLFPKLLKNISYKDAANLYSYSPSNQKYYFEALVNARQEASNNKDKSLVGLDLEGILDNAILDQALMVIHTINQEHDESDDVRFEIVEKADYKILYNLITNGEDELYTSSYNGLFNRMMNKLKLEDITGDKLFEKMDNKDFRIFIKLASRYNRLKEFMNSMDKKSQLTILNKFCKNIDKEASPLAEALSIADVFSVIKDPETINVFRDCIKSEYFRLQKSNNREVSVMYGLLGSLLSKHENELDKWYTDMSKEFKITPIDKISAADLFDHNNINTQQYYFYNDPDGQASYRDFIETYKDQPGWGIKDYGNYICISSLGTDKKIQIYANKPAHEEGQEEIIKMLNEKKINPQTVVHRGHSFHTEKTIQHISSSTKLVYLGSCGGYNEISNIYNKSKDCQIFSTKGIGTGLVNEPLLKMLDEDILKGNDIYWDKFWAKAKNRLGSHKEFTNYIPPNENFSALLLATYNSYLKK